MASNAIVARTTVNGLAYLGGRASGDGWVSKAYEAETFMSMREATRAALVLPGNLRAFALPVAAHA
ncbi:MAG TPA: hypothetical protein VGF50_12670 [Caulobacteraceae bacterium]|jgi:hypothetical protein